jgi:hypothetical protein
MVYRECRWVYLKGPEKVSNKSPAGLMAGSKVSGKK